MTSILSDTFAPPMIATNGRSGVSSACPRYCEFLFHQQSRRGLREVVRDSLDRRMRPVRRAERVVHVSRRERRERLRKHRVVLLFFRMETQVLEQDDIACRVARRIADAVGRKGDGLSEQRRQPIRDRPEAHLGVDLALRPSQVAREDDRRAVVERVADGRQRRRMRVSSPIVPLFSGTLKSTRMKTRWPFRSRSLMESFTDPSRRACAAGRRSGSSSPTRCRTTTGPSGSRRPSPSCTACRRSRSAGCP